MDAIRGIGNAVPIPLGQALAYEFALSRIDAAHPLETDSPTDIISNRSGDVVSGPSHHIVPILKGSSLGTAISLDSDDEEI